DKLGADFRGDPGAALMEVLDPEQNASFRDHYLDVPFDLSKVLFITTANLLDAVPAALRDRMEVLELPGYSDGQKLAIAQQYLVPRQVRENGLILGEQIAFADDALRTIIRNYTREAGVRGLERVIGALCRKHARVVASGAPRDATALRVTSDLLEDKLGAPPFLVEVELTDAVRPPGVALALAWTPLGGEVLFVEAARMPRDQGEVTLTGHMGEVMQESARTALSWVRANAEQYGISPDAFALSDVHVHVPSGAAPKDGPSAGIVMAAALVSAFTGRSTRPLVAMTGEITLTGRVLPVGGLQEKVLAAKRSGVREIVVPRHNEPQVRELREELREGLDFHFASSIEEGLAFAFAPGAPAREAAPKRRALVVGAELPEPAPQAARSGGG
ncbi:MAG TPA: S16 family serine protease, partial [Polyangiaceae bacterium]